MEIINISGLLQPLSILSQWWTYFLIDLIIGLPKSEGKSVVMVVVDKITKYSHFNVLSHPFKVSMITNSFMETIQKLHGTPNIILSDRDLIFTSNFWTKLFSCLGTQMDHISSYHPQSDGQTCIVKKCLEGYIWCFAVDKQTKWVKWTTPQWTKI